MKFRVTFFIIIATVLVGYSCRKGNPGEPKWVPANVPDVPNVLNMFKVKLTLHKSQSYAIGDDNVVSIGPADSVLID